MAGTYIITSDALIQPTVATITQVDSRTVDITLSGEMKTGNLNYTVTVSNVVGTYTGLEIDVAKNHGHFSGQGVPPTVVSASFPGNRLLQVIFSEAMSLTNLDVVGNYSIVGPPGSPAITVVHVVSNWGALGYVYVEYDGNMWEGGAYTVTVTNVTDEVGNPIGVTAFANVATFAGILAPEVLPATFYSPFDKLTVYFNQPMANAGLENPSNYFLTSDALFNPVISLVEKQVNNTQVEITFVTPPSENKIGIDNYALHARNIVSASHRWTILSAHDHGHFSGVGGRPTTTGAVATWINAVEVTFSEPMDSTHITDYPTLYVFGSSDTPITAASVHQDSPTKVTITTTGTMTLGTGNYTVEVLSDPKICDLVGNYIDPSTKQVFDGVSVPKVLSGSRLAGRITLTFDQIMADGSVGTTGLEDHNNYWFTSDALVQPTVTEVTKGGGNTLVYVDFTGEMKTGVNNYKLNVQHVVNPTGIPIAVGLYNWWTFSGVGAAPGCSEVVVSPTNLQYQFTEAMSATGLNSNGNYNLDCPPGAAPISIVSVTPNGGRTYVDIATSGEMNQSPLYSITASNVTDLVGNLIDPTSGHHHFTGAGVSPTVISTTGGLSEWSLVYSEYMSNSVLTAGNYSVPVFPAGSPVSVASVHRDGGNGVHLVVSGEQEIGVNNYTLVVTGVVDPVGNPIGGPNWGYVNGQGTRLYVTGLVVDSWDNAAPEYVLELTMNVNIKNNSALWDAGNYIITKGVGDSGYHPDGVGWGSSNNKVLLTFNRKMAAGVTHRLTVVNLVTEHNNPLDSPTHGECVGAAFTGPLLQHEPTSWYVSSRFVALVYDADIYTLDTTTSHWYVAGRTVASASFLGNNKTVLIEITANFTPNNMYQCGTAAGNTSVDVAGNGIQIGTTGIHVPP